MKVICPLCYGKGIYPAKIQFSDRRRECEIQNRTCPVCDGDKFVTEDVVRDFTAKYGSVSADAS